MITNYVMIINFPLYNFIKKVSFTAIQNGEINIFASIESIPKMPNSFDIVLVYIRKEYISIELFKVRIKY